MIRRRTITSALVSVALSSALAVTPPAVALQECVGDCDGDGQVSISDLVKAVNIALSKSSLVECHGVDSSNDGTVKVHELVLSVKHALFGCLDPNVNYVEIHDPTSSDYDEKCLSCHEEKLDEGSLDPLVVSFHPLKLASVVIPGATSNDKCVYCHTEVDFSGNRSAGNLRRQVDVNTCTPCHTGGSNPYYQPH